MATKPVQLCCLRIGFEDFLIPADKGMKVAELMQSAVACERKYGDVGFSYEAKGQPEIAFSMVKPNQVRMPDAEAPVAVRPRQRLIGN